MKHKVVDDAIQLLSDISSRGLLETVRGNHAFETLGRILETGTSLPGGVQEDEALTEKTALVLSDPRLWGIVDPKWEAFLNERGTM